MPINLKKLIRFRLSRLADKFRGRTLTKIEKRFCLENGISERFALGDQFDVRVSFRRDPFWIREGRNFDERPVINQIDALKIIGKPRFANAIITLINSVSFAKEFNIPKVYHPNFIFLKNGQIDNSVTLTNEPGPDENTLISKFFYNHTLKDLNRRHMSRYETMQLLRPAMNFDISGKALGSEGTLFIHVRSGDIFDKPQPHPSYGQPPFAFYKKIIHSGKWDSVVLVCENNSNPVIESIKSYLNEQEIRLDIYSGSLESDLNILSTARNLVVGRGTFIYPLLCLSHNIKNVYCFEYHNSHDWGLERADIRFHLVKDREGSYVKDVYSYWRNSPEQTQLMLAYPEENLVFV